jgi:hypothetical protein
MKSSFIPSLPRLVSAIVLLCFPGLLRAADDAGNKQALIGHLWSWKSATKEAQVAFEPDGSFKMKGVEATYQWELADGGKVRIALPNGKSMELEFNKDFTGFKETGKATGGAIGTRLQARTVKAEVAKPAVVPANPNDMALSADWRPAEVQTRRELLESLEFYSLKVLGGKRKAPDLIPTTIWGPVTWLMPVQKAEAMLPKNARKHRFFEMENQAFPQSSLRVKMYAVDGKPELSDRGNPFKYISFITDLSDRVIGIQLMSATPKIVVWEGGKPDGVKEPYYNFIEDRMKGSTRNSVPYQVRDAGRGVKLIKTALLDSPLPLTVDGASMGLNVNLKYSENVHWYLTAPLAEKLLEIVDIARQKGKL